MAALLAAELTPESLRQLGAAMHEITAAIRPLGPGRRRRWFQGAVYTELTVDFTGSEISRFELSFEGRWVAFDQGRVSTGRTDEHTADSVVPISKLVARDADASSEIISAARQVLSALCDPDLGQALLDMLGS